MTAALCWLMAATVWVSNGRKPAKSIVFRRLPGGAEADEGIFDGADPPNVRVQRNGRSTTTGRFGYQPNTHLPRDGSGETIVPGDDDLTCHPGAICC
jgi:hypothetical protein